jgi:uncharacterized phage-associated protein
MKAATIKFAVPEERLESLVTELRGAIKEDCGTEYPASAIRNSVISWLDSRLDALFEDAVERLTSPSYDDARDFARMLDETDASPAPVYLPDHAGLEALTVFNGFRALSPDRMAVMVSHLAARTTELYKTKLNKLLFYADFVNFYHYGRSISGFRYLHLPYGPVPNGYEETLKELKGDGIIDILASGSSELIQSGGNTADTGLTSEEIETLDWVADTYGKLSASQLTELSHRERAYRDTKTGEEIAYEYAKFLANLPPKKGSDPAGKSY